MTNYPDIPPDLARLLKQAADEMKEQSSDGPRIEELQSIGDIYRDRATSGQVSDNPISEVVRLLVDIAAMLKDLPVKLLDEFEDRYGS